LAGCPRFAPALWALTWANDADFPPIDDSATPQQKKPTTQFNAGVVPFAKNSATLPPRELGLVNECYRLIATPTAAIGCFLLDLKASCCNHGTPVICHPDPSWRAVGRGLQTPLQTLGYTDARKVSRATGRAPKANLQSICLFARRSGLGLRDVRVFNGR